MCHRRSRSPAPARQGYKTWHDGRKYNMKAFQQVNPHFIRYVRGFGEQWLGVERASMHVKFCWQKWAILQIAQGVDVFPIEAWDSSLTYDPITGAASPTLV